MSDNQAESSTAAPRRSQRAPKPNRDPMFLYATEFTEGRRNATMFSRSLDDSSVSRSSKRKTPMTDEEKRKRGRERKRAARARLSQNGSTDIVDANTSSANVERIRRNAESQRASRARRSASSTMEAPTVEVSAAEDTVVDNVATEEPVENPRVENQVSEDGEVVERRRRATERQRAYRARRLAASREVLLVS